MFYRFEARYTGEVLNPYVDNNWHGIFHAFNPHELRQWHCLTEPKWYDKHADIPSHAWFTEYGYQKWHNKMEDAIKHFHYDNSVNWEFRLLRKETLTNCVFMGKTQAIELL